MNELIARLFAAGTPPELVAEVAMELGRLNGERDALDRRRAADAARQQERRDRIKAEDEARHVTSRDVTDVTGVAPFLDKEKSPRPPKEINPIPRTDSARAREAIRLPAEWRPAKCNDGTIARQIIDHRGQDWAKRALESFQNHWHAANGPNARKRDWQAAWGNWVIEQDRRDGNNGQRNGNHRNGQSATGFGPTIDAAARFAAREGHH